MSRFPIFDTHAHLQDPDFDEDREQLLEFLKAEGVARVVLPASDLADSEKALNLALAHPGLFCEIGVHPHEASSWVDGPEGSAEVLRRLFRRGCEESAALGRPNVIVGLGEIGLDYHYDFSPREVQKKVYRQQLELAAELGLPVIIHEREAFADSLAILQDAWRDGLLSIPGSCHCFSGSLEGSRQLLELGFYLGFDGPITFKKARKALEVLAEIPADRYLLETDSPYLTPEPFRGRRNDPSKIWQIAEKAAEIRGQSVEEILRQNWENACRFYRLPMYVHFERL